MNRAFRRAFRHNLRVLKQCRELSKQQLMNSKRVQMCSRVGSIHVAWLACGSDGYAQVFELTPKCGYVRLIGTKWYEMPAAIDSATRLIARRMREKQGVTNKT